MNDYEDIQIISFVDQYRWREFRINYIWEEKFDSRTTLQDYTTLERIAYVKVPPTTIDTIK